MQRWHSRIASPPMSVLQSPLLDDRNVKPSPRNLIMAESTSNPLLSIGRAPDTALQVQLHPLVLLTISDYLTRHTLRQQDTPVIGVILGQQNGRDVTMEHAFECKASIDYGCIKMDTDWFTERLEECKSFDTDRHDWLLKGSN